MLHKIDIIWMKLLQHEAYKDERGILSLMNNKDSSSFVFEKVEDIIRGWQYSVENIILICGIIN